MATISTRSASLVRKSESGTREGAKTNARLEEEEVSIATSIRSVLFIYRCLPTYLRQLPAAAFREPAPTCDRDSERNLEPNRILPSFLSHRLDQVSRRSSVFWVSKVAAARSRELAVENPFQELGQQLASTRPLRDERLWRIFRIRIRRNDPPRRKLEYETNIVALRSPIDRSIHRSIDESTKQAGQTYGAVFCFGKVSCVPDRTKEAFVPRRTAALGNYQRSYSSTWFRESLVRDSRSRFPSR